MIEIVDEGVVAAFTRKMYPGLTVIFFGEVTRIVRRVVRTLAVGGIVQGYTVVVFTNYHVVFYDKIVEIIVKAADTLQQTYVAARAAAGIVHYQVAPHDTVIYICAGT